MSNNSMILSRVYFMIFIFLQLNIYAQINTIESYGTKSNALSSVATVLKDINAAYTNQAGLAYIEGLNINLSYENRFSNYSLSSINFAIANKFNKIGTFAFIIKKFGFSEYNEMQVGTAYALKLNNATSLAFQANLFNLSITGYGSKSTLSFDTGIIHDFTNKLSFGFHISNPFPISFIEKQDIPTIVKIGFSYKISDYLIFYSDFDKHIKYDLFIKSAIEYQPINIFSIYLGFKNNFEGVADYSMGFSYRFNDKFKVEMSTIYDLTLGLSPSIGFNYSANGNNNL